LICGAFPWLTALMVVERNGGKNLVKMEARVSDVGEG